MPPANQIVLSRKPVLAWCRPRHPVEDFNKIVIASDVLADLFTGNAIGLNGLKRGVNVVIFTCFSFTRNLFSIQRRVPSRYSIPAAKTMATSQPFHL